MTRDGVLDQLGVSPEAVAQLCESLQIVRLRIVTPIAKSSHPDTQVGRRDNSPMHAGDLPEHSSVGVVVQYRVEPSLRAVWGRLATFDRAFGALVGRAVSSFTIAVLRFDPSRSSRDALMKYLVTIHDARTGNSSTENPNGKTALQPGGDTGEGKPKRAARQPVIVRTRTDDSGRFVVEISYSVKASKVVARAAEIRREDTRARWAALASSDLEEDAVLIEDYREAWSQALDGEVGKP